MKFFLILMCIFLFNSSFTQDYTKMNKRELQGYVQSLLNTQKIIEDQRDKINTEKNELKSTLESRNEKLTAEFFELKKENQKLVSDYEYKIGLLSKEKNLLEDSINFYVVEIKTRKPSLGGSSNYSANNFLNQYFFEDMTIANKSFKMVLSKIIMGNVKKSSSYYNEDNSINAIPEILESTNFTYYTIKPEIKINDFTNFNSLVVEGKVNELNSKLPSIQIINNKFLSINYSDNTNEAFLFSAQKNLECNPCNNNRGYLSFNFEGADDNNNDVDINWKAYVIGDNVYLALSASDLKRIKVDVRSYSDGVHVTNEDKTRSRNFSSDDFSYYASRGYQTSGKGIYFSRKKDPYINTTYYSNIDNLVFLFELHETQLNRLAIDAENDDKIPITVQTQKLKPEIIEVIEDEEEIEETIIESTETDQEEIIEVVEEYVDTPVPFAIIEDVPLFPGCERVAKSERRSCFQSKIQQHIAKNFRYPEIAQEMGIQGRVFVQFTIGTNGSISGIRTRGPDKNLEKEANRIISLLPRMTPGKQRGRPVRVPFSIPITFKLQ